jgi:hypothetical protein
VGTNNKDRQHPLVVMVPGLPTQDRLVVLEIKVI